MATHTDALITKQELCDLLKLPSVKAVERLMREKRIPFIRVSPRSVRFNAAKVLASLEKFESKQAGEGR